MASLRFFSNPGDDHTNLERAVCYNKLQNIGQNVQDLQRSTASTHAQSRDREGRNAANLEDKWGRSSVG